MGIQQISRTLVLRVDDKGGNAIYNKVQSLATGLDFPPLPRVGETVEFNLPTKDTTSIDQADGMFAAYRQFFAEVKQSKLAYHIDDVTNIHCIATILATEK